MKPSAMLFIALFLMRLYLFFGGNRWIRWNQYVAVCMQLNGRRCGK